MTNYVCTCNGFLAIFSSINLDKFIYYAILTISQSYSQSSLKVFVNIFLKPTSWEPLTTPSEEQKSLPHSHLQSTVRDQFLSFVLGWALMSNRRPKKSSSFPNPMNTVQQLISPVKRWLHSGSQRGWTEIQKATLQCMYQNLAAKQAIE